VITLFLLEKRFNIIDDFKKLLKKNIFNNNKILSFIHFIFFSSEYCMCCWPSEFYEMSAGFFCSVKFGALNFPFEPRLSPVGRQDPVGRLVAPEKTVARKFD